MVIEYNRAGASGAGPILLTFGTTQNVFLYGTE